MKVVVLKVGNSKSSSHGGVYKRCIFKDISIDSVGKEYIFDCYSEHSNSKRFWPYLKEQALFDGVDVIEYNGKKVINGNNDFHYCGQRH